MSIIYSDTEAGICIKKSAKKQGEIVEIFRDNKLVRTYSYKITSCKHDDIFDYLKWENLIYREGLGANKDFEKFAVQQDKKLVSILSYKKTTGIAKLLKKIPEGCSYGILDLNGETVICIVKDGRLNQYIHPWDVERNLRGYDVELSNKEKNLLREYSTLPLEELVGNFIKELINPATRVDFIVNGLIGGIPLEIIAAEVTEKFPENAGINNALRINCTSWSGLTIELKTNLRIYPDSEIDTINCDEDETIKLKTFNPRFGDLEFVGYNKLAIDSATSVYQFLIDGTDDWILSIQTYSTGAFRTYSRVPVHVCYYKKDKLLEISFTTKVVWDKENDMVEVYSSEHENMIYKIERGWLPSILS